MVSELSLSGPLETLHQWEQKKPDAVFLRQPIKGEWQNYTWKRCGDEIRRMAAAIDAMQYPRGSKIAILSKNCVHWMLSDFAIWMAGHISVPLYPNLAHTTVRQILEHSESKMLFAGKLDDWSELRKGIPENIDCIAFPFYGIEEYPNWNDVIKKHEPLQNSIARDLDEIATIMYTSGTTGKPKGVMHSFFNFAYAATNAFPVIQVDDAAKFFSYLPMCHIAERLLVEIGSLYTGSHISFAESLESFPHNLNDTEPTVFLAVPRIWAKFQEKILEKMPQKKLNRFLSVPVLNGIVKNKIRKNLGLRKATNIFSGAAPLPVGTMLWFQKIGISIQQAYAMTEDCCYSHVNLREKNRIGTVGQKLPHVEIKIADNGEILVKHKALMKGYYKEPELTAEVFTEDGFFKTGDTGQVDADGYLTITGRVKEIFKTSKGKYVVPTPIEMKLSVNPDIDQVLVVGLGLPQPICLIVLSEAGKQKQPDAVEKSIKDSVKDISDELDHHEQIEKVVILKNDWTIENGLLTPTLKIKRNEVEKKFSQFYQEWYERKEFIIRE